MQKLEPSTEKLELEIRELKKKLTQSVDAFLNIIGKNRDGILIFNLEGKIIYANPAVLELFGKDLGELLGENIGIFIGKSNRTELTIIHKERGAVHIEFNIADTTWNNHPAKLASLRDVTEHKKAKNILEQLSHFDYLTRLANRVTFEEMLKKSLAWADRIKKNVVLMYLDMDGFKIVNDTFGHPVGDKLLIHVAHILKSSVREEDVVARLGGDEFAIILERTDGTDACERIAQSILNKIKEPIVIETHTIHVNFSIGIAVYPDNADNPHELLTNADTAMYQAKKAGRGQYKVFF